MVSEKKVFFSFSHYKSMEANVPRGVASLDPRGLFGRIYVGEKKVKEKFRESHNHKPQPFPDTKRKRKPNYPNKHKSDKRTKSTKINSLSPKQGNRNAKRTEKHKNKMIKVRNKTNRLVE